MAKWDGSVWACNNDTDTDTNTDTLAGLSCASGQVAKWDGSVWACQNDSGGTSYTADGTTLELTGSQFSIKASGVSSTELANLAVTEDKLAASLTFDDGDLVDLSPTYTTSAGTSKGLVLPKANDVSTATVAGQISWDADDNKLYVGTGSGTQEIGSGTETDPQVGTVTNGQWCLGDVSGVVQCQSSADGTLLDLSSINASDITEGIILPQAADVSAALAEGQITWDSDNDSLYVGNGSEAIVIGSSTDASGNVVFYDSNGNEVLRIEPGVGDDGPNIIGGHSENEATSGVQGAFIGGGGSTRRR